MEQIDTLLEKYDYFKYAQIRSVESSSDTSKTITLVVQDDEGEDINTVSIEFKDIKESRILVNSVLAFLDMASGISIIKEHDLYGFAVGSGTSMAHVNSAPMFIIASDIAIEEK